MDFFPVSIDIANDIFIQPLSNWSNVAKKEAETSLKKSIIESTTINISTIVRISPLFIFYCKYFFAALDVSFCFFRFYLSVGFVELNSRPFVCNIRFIFAINFSMKLYARRLPFRWYRLQTTIPVIHIFSLPPFAPLFSPHLFCLLFS